MCICVQVALSVYLFVYLYVRMYACTYVLMYTSICTFVHKHMYVTSQHQIQCYMHANMCNTQDKAINFDMCLWVHTCTHMSHSHACWHIVVAFMCKRYILQYTQLNRIYITYLCYPRFLLAVSVHSYHWTVMSRGLRI